MGAAEIIPAIFSFPWRILLYFGFRRVLRKIVHRHSGLTGAGGRVRNKGLLMFATHTVVRIDKRAVRVIEPRPDVQFEERADAVGALTNWKPVPGASTMNSTPTNFMLFFAGL
jgi:hypothetical protein